MLNLRRSLPVFKPDECPPIILIGCGATGSKVFEHLVCLGVKEIHCFDFDDVEAHNLGNQLFLQRDVGYPKVLGLRQWAVDKAGEDATKNYHFNTRRVDSNIFITLNDLESPAIVLNLVDSMKARKNIAIGLQGHEKCLAMLETRIAATYGFVYNINNYDKKAWQRWEATLFEDSEAVTESACGSQVTISPTVDMAASVVVSQIMSLINEDGLTPFFQEFYTKQCSLRAEV